MKILGYNYKIVNTEDLYNLESFGKLSAKLQEIKISKDLHKEAKISTLLHEIIEALNFHLELGLDHRTITSLEAGLFQVFKDNNIDLSPLMGSSPE